MRLDEKVLISLLEEYFALMKKLAVAPRAKYSEPITSSQEYGWDIEPLVRRDLFNTL